MFCTPLASAALFKTTSQLLTQLLPFADVLCRLSLSYLYFESPRDALSCAIQNPSIFSFWDTENHIRRIHIVVECNENTIVFCEGDQRRQLTYAELWDVICDATCPTSMPLSWRCFFLEEIRDKLLHDFPIRNSGIDLIAQLKHALWNLAPDVISVPIFVHPFPLPDGSEVHQVYFHICPPSTSRSKRRPACGHRSCQMETCSKYYRATFEHAQYQYVGFGALCQDCKKQNDSWIPD